MTAALRDPKANGPHVGSIVTRARTPAATELAVDLNDRHGGIARPSTNPIVKAPGCSKVRVDSESGCSRRPGLHVRPQQSGPGEGRRWRQGVALALLLAVLVPFGRVAAAGANVGGSVVEREGVDGRTLTVDYPRSAKDHGVRAETSTAAGGHAVESPHATGSEAQRSSAYWAGRSPWIVIEVASWILVALVVLSLPRLVVGRLRRRHMRQRLLRPVDRDGWDASVTARGLRSEGRWLGFWLLGLLSLVLALPAVYGLAGMILSIIPALSVRLVLESRRREERATSLGRRFTWRRPRLVRTAVLSSIAAVPLTLGLLILGIAAGLQTMSIVTDNTEDRQRFFAGSAVFVLYGVIAFAVAVVLDRIRRRQGRLRAAELRIVDRRKSVLYLRGFADDRLRVPQITSGRRTAIDLLYSLPTDRFENVISWVLDSAGPTVALAPPKRRLSSLGPALEHAETPEWIRHIERRIDESVLVVISLSATDGLLQELQLVADRALDRTILVFPPTGLSEIRRRWAVACSVLSQKVDCSLPVDPTDVLVAFTRRGRLIAVTADQRDEAGYRAALGYAMGQVLAELEYRAFTDERGARRAGTRSRPTGPETVVGAAPPPRSLLNGGRLDSLSAPR